MDKKKFKGLCVNAGFGLLVSKSGLSVIVSPNNQLDIIQNEVERLKAIILDEVIKEVQTLSPRSNGLVSELVGIVVSKIEEMK